MAGEGEAALHALRMRYKAVYSAHRDCVRALNEARMSGGPTPSGLLEKEARVREELAAARAALLAAMTRTADEPTSA